MLIAPDRFKLHMRPRSLASTHIDDQDLPPLPRGKTATSVFADFLHYLYNCAKIYILESHFNGAELWNSLQGTAQFVLSHPNGWEGPQQAQMRVAAVKAELIPDTPEGQSQVQLVTEGEASLHYCLTSGEASEAMMARPTSCSFFPELAEVGAGYP
jgi:hypothetical protein